MTTKVLVQNEKAVKEYFTIESQIAELTEKLNGIKEDLIAQYSEKLQPETNVVVQGQNGESLTLVGTFVHTPDKVTKEMEKLEGQAKALKDQAKKIEAELKAKKEKAKGTTALKTVAIRKK
jgi:chromosome segregation ATPase